MFFSIYAPQKHSLLGNVLWSSNGVWKDTVQNIYEFIIALGSCNLDSPCNMFYNYIWRSL